MLVIKRRILAGQEVEKSSCQKITIKLYKIVPNNHFNILKLKQMRRCLFMKSTEVCMNSMYMVFLPGDTSIHYLPALYKG